MIFIRDAASRHPVSYHILEDGLDVKSISSDYISKYEIEESKITVYGTKNSWKEIQDTVQITCGEDVVGVPEFFEETENGNTDTYL